MKHTNRNRGQIRIIEAFFASVLMFSAIALIPSQTIVGTSNDQFLYSIARNVLPTLDNDASLSKLIMTQDWTTLTTQISLALPSSVWFNLTIFDENMNPITQPLISRGTPNGRIVSTDYVCASQEGDFSIYIIRLQLSTVG